MRGDTSVLGLPPEAPELSAVALLDGVHDLAQVLDRVSLPAVRLQRLLQRLQVLGMVELNPSMEPPPPEEQAARPAAVPRAPAAVLPAAPSADVATVRPPLTAEQEEMIRREYGRVREAAPHDVLAVGEHASAKEVQRAYYALVQRFHPDAFFGRDLGVLEAQLFEITQRHYEAYHGMRQVASAAPEAEAAPPKEPEPGTLDADARAQFERGLAFFRKNDYVRARPFFELACAFDPENPGYREHLDRVKRGLGISD